MKDKVLLARLGVVVTTFAVIAGIFFLKYSTSKPADAKPVSEPGPSAAAASTAAANGSSHKSSHSRKAKVVQAKVIQAKSDSPGETKPVLRPQPLAVYREEAAVAPFPNAKDVQPGVSRADVVRDFGTPDVSVVSGGRERLLYLGHNRSTSVAVQNGTTAASRTDNFDARGISPAGRSNP